MRTALLAALAALPLTALAAPADLPQRKPGLWEVSNQMEAAGGHTQTMEMCVGKDTDNLMAEAGKDSSDCDPPKTSRDGARMVVDTVCRMDGHTTTSHAVFSGDFGSNYQADINIRYSPPMHGMASTAMKIKGRWLGPCKPGQKPGDVQMKGMPMNFNMEEMMKNMPKGPAR